MTLESLQSHIDALGNNAAGEIRLWRQARGEYVAADANGAIWQPRPTLEKAIESLLIKAAQKASRT